MPFEERNAMEQRNEFIDRCISKRETISELCEWFGISRKTGYKWIKRYDGGGRGGLVDLSRAPRHHPQQIEAERAAAIIRARQQHPSWGARKLLRFLKDQTPEQTWPAASSLGELLK